MTNNFETYKLALALYVGSVIDQPPTSADQMLDILLGMQNSDGGFFTHYTSGRTAMGDTNTETTAFVLLALNAVGCGD